MEHTIRTFSPAGDTVLATWSPEDVDSTETARSFFNRARRDGFAAVEESPEGAVALEEFRPTAPTIWLLRPIAGG